MRRGLIVVVVVALGFLSTAPASARIVITPPAGTQRPYQHWVDLAKIPTPGFTVGLVEMSNADPLWPCRSMGGPFSGCAVTSEREIYLDPSAVEPRMLLYHELGHIFDSVRLTEADRRWFTRHVGPHGPWLSDQNHNTAGENFADTYSSCLRFGAEVRYAQIELENGSFIYPRRHRQLCRWIQRLTGSS